MAIEFTAGRVTNLWHWHSNPDTNHFQGGLTHWINHVRIAWSNIIFECYLLGTTKEISVIGLVCIIWWLKMLYIQAAFLIKYIQLTRRVMYMIGKMLELQFWVNFQTFLLNYTISKLFIPFLLTPQILQVKQNDDLCHDFLLTTDDVLCVWHWKTNTY